jgi:ATP-dependent DNA ligase
MLFFAVLRLTGITLIEVPYWWNKKYESLAATVFNQRPDLFAERPMGTPIPLTIPAKINMPSNSSLSRNLQLAESKKTLMTATVWDEPTMDSTGWWLTEKFDGMRLFWNGSQFFSRQGNVAKIPEFLTKQLPYFALDGELWYLD